MKAVIKGVLIFHFLIFFVDASGQLNSDSTVFKKIEFDGLLGVGIDWFENNIDQDFNVLTPELRVGILGRLPLNRWQIELEISAGYRPSSKYVAYENVSNPEYDYFIDYLQKGLDVKSMLVNPTLSVGFKVTESLVLKSGVSYNHFFGIEPTKSFLHNFNSWGGTFGFGYRINDRVSFNVLYFLPMAKENLVHLVDSNKTGYIKYQNILLGVSMPLH